MYMVIRKEYYDSATNAKRLSAQVRNPATLLATPVRKPFKSHHPSEHFRTFTTPVKL